MKVPYSWLSEFAALPQEISLEELENAFVRVGFEVESIDIQGEGLTGPLVVARVESIEELKEHKKPIRYVGLDCGEGAIRFVICGAQNFAVGDLVVASLPGAVLPGNFVISARETYGKTSNGMICSARELGISDEHSGIIVLAPGSAKIGDNAIDLLQINDRIIDVAVNPDRGYALSIRGLARELAASLGVAYTDPASLVDSKSLEINTKGVQPIIEDPTAVSVIYLRTVSSFDPSAKTPLWMSRRIEKCGMRSISLAVDITNYVMLELGQPLHAFDRSQIKGSLHIRRAGSEKTFTTLDGQERFLASEDLMVADDERALALAGTMGGLNSEVTSSTTEITIEAARFDPMSVAKNSRRHRLSSEASRRLERAVDPALAEIASARAVALLTSLGGASHIGSAFAGQPIFPTPVSFDPHYPTALLGVEITSDVVESKLITVGASIEKKSETHWLVTPAQWRPDLQSQPDLVEEVARMIGFDAIPSRLPIGKGGATLSPLQKRKRLTAANLATAGFAEVYNFPFISQQMLDSLGFVGDRAKAFRLANPMSEEFPLLRTHLLPGLLQTAVRNQSRGFKNVALFEIGSVFRDNVELPVQDLVATDSRPSDETLAKIYGGVPKQPIHVAGVVLGSLENKNWQGAPTPYSWSDSIAAAEKIVTGTGNRASVHASDFAPWHPGRCAELRVDGKAIAHAGELHPRVIAELGLPPRSCAFVVVLSELPYAPVVRTEPISAMPLASQDISLLIDSSIAAGEIEAALIEGAGELLESVLLFDRYDQAEPGKVSLAYTLNFRAPDRTLTADEVTAFRESAGRLAAERHGAVIRS
jgi:phenylalanyl-tRNA synthetase beta chain